MSDKTAAARRAVDDYRRERAWGRTPSPWRLVAWVEKLADELEKQE